MRYNCRSTVHATLAVLLSAPFIACAGQPAAAPAVTPRFLVSSDSLMKSLPFSEAVQVGNLLFLSGQIGVLPGTSTLALRRTSSLCSPAASAIGKSGD